MTAKPESDAIARGTADPVPPMRVALPEWWLDEPEEHDGQVGVCAMADDEDLLAARRRALEEAGRVFREATEKSAEDAGVVSDSVRLRDGRFRAYVRLTGRR
jgi:hypothetical protein